MGAFLAVSFCEVKQYFWVLFFHIMGQTPVSVLCVRGHKDLNHIFEVQIIAKKISRYKLVLKKPILSQNNDKSQKTKKASNARLYKGLHRVF